MIDDLKIIKKYYGEKMMHFCRSSFATIIDKEAGRLSKIMLEHFEKNKFLYDDLVNFELQVDFKDYIYNFINVQEKKEIIVNKNPKELLKEAGYTLYECKSEEDIQKFKKYYAKGEELCTFSGERLNSCIVFFAVKDNALSLKRKDFINPKRQDEYGTSVISIQFTKDSSHTLSIKNRYNHKVNNPDATFSNNLDKIVPGLSKSFEIYYNLKQKREAGKFEIQGYFIDDSGKFYKYNYEINNVYYCPNNVIIDRKNVRKCEKEKYIIMDYFVLDLVNKEIYLYDLKLKDSFVNSFGKISNIKILNEKKQKRVIITNEKREKINILLSKENKIISLVNNSIEYIGDNFLCWNNSLKYLEIDKVKEIGNEFLFYNMDLKELKALNLEYVGHDFMFYNINLRNINIPNLKEIGECFLFNNDILNQMISENLKHVKSNSLELKRK